MTDNKHLIAAHSFLSHCVKQSQRRIVAKREKNKDGDSQRIKDKRLHLNVSKKENAVVVYNQQKGRYTLGNTRSRMVRLQINTDIILYSIVRTEIHFLSPPQGKKREYSNVCFF